MSKYQYVCGAVLIQPNPDDQTVTELYHTKCRPKRRDGYMIEDRNPEVDFDADGKPKRHVCPECGHEIGHEIVATLKGDT